MPSIDGSLRVIWRSLVSWGQWLAFTSTLDSIVLICFPIPAIIPVKSSVIIWFTVVLAETRIVKDSCMVNKLFTDQICLKTLKMILYAILNYP